MDESGNFDFSRERGASRYFILAAATFPDCSQVNARLSELRHQLAWEGHDHPDPFHAAHDPAPVRSRVFDIIAELEGIRIDVLLLEKAKAMPHLRTTEERFYQHAWFYLMKYVAPRLSCDELLVVTGSLGKKKKRTAFYEAVREVMKQVGGPIHYKTACWEASSDCCLQVADYCGWAIQRKWESADPGPYLRIASKIRSAYDLFGRGTKVYY